MSVTTRYEQALSRIKGQIYGIVHGGDPEGSDTRELRVWLILKSALELHGQKEVWENEMPTGEFYCTQCGWIIQNFPCPTAEKIIEGVLG